MKKLDSIPLRFVKAGLLILKARLLILVACISFILMPLTYSAEEQSAAAAEPPSAVIMIADMILARPLLLTATVIGTAFFIVSLPFSLLGGNATEAADALVTQPFKATFLRCLGCTYTGEKHYVNADSK